MLCPSLLLGSNEPTKMTVYYKDGQKKDIMFSAKPAITFTSDKLVFSCAGAETEAFFFNVIAGIAFTQDDVPVYIPSKPSGGGTQVINISIGSQQEPDPGPGPDPGPDPQHEPISISEATVTLSQTTYIYTGAPIIPELTVEYQGKALVGGTDYTVDYGSNVQPGTVTMTIIGQGDYTGSVTKTFTIVRSQTVMAMVNGEEFEPTFYKLSDDIIQATYSTQYGVVRISNCYAVAGEEVTLWVTPAEGYTISKADITPELSGEDPANLNKLRIYKYVMPASGAVTVLATFHEAIDLADAVVSLTPSEGFVYTGEAVVPACSVTFDGKVLTADVDYTLSYQNNVDAGNAWVAITGKGQYMGSRNIPFVISKAPLTVTATAQSRVYGQQNPELTYTITGYVGEEDVASLTKLPVAATEATTKSPVGEYAIAVSGAEAKNYDFNYVDATLTVTRCNLADQVQVIVDERHFYYTGQETIPIFVVQHGDTTLVAETDYAVIMANNINASTASLTIVGIGNYRGSIDQTFEIEKAQLTVTADAQTKVYGEENPVFTTSITGFVNNEDASVLLSMPTAVTDCSPESPVGEYAITVSGGEAQNYDFSYVNATLTVTPRSIEDATVTLADSVAYTAEPVLPDLTVQCGSLTLTEGVDYSVSATNNTEPGNAELTIEGQGNYAGTINKTFVIYLKPSVVVSINGNLVEPVLDNKNKAEFTTDYGKVVISDYYARPNQNVTMYVTKSDGWLVGENSIEASTPIETISESLNPYVGTYVVPEDGVVTVNVRFVVDEIYVGIGNRTADALRFEIVDAKTVRVLGAAGTAPVSVYDARGQQVAAEVMRSERELIVRLARQPQGLYIIKVNNNTFKVYRK